MIENENNKLTFVVGSSPVFPFPIRFFKKTDIHCYLWRDGKSIELQQNTDFTVETKDDYSNGANIELKTTGTINLPNGIPQGCSLVILREVELLQETALPNNGKLPSEALERQLDKFAAMMQQLREELSRCVKLAVASGESPESVVAMILGAKDMALDSASTAASAAAACSSAQLTIATIWSEITGDSASAEEAIDALKEAWEAAGSVKAAAEAGKASVNEASLAAVEYAKGQIEEAQDASLGVLSATTKSRKEELLALIAETVGAEGSVAAAVQAAKDAAAAAEEETGKIETLSASAQASISAAVTVADQKKQEAQTAANEAAAQAEAAEDSAAEAYSYIAQTLANKNAAQAAQVAAEAAKADAVAAAGSASDVANASITAHNVSQTAHEYLRNLISGKEASGTAASAVSAHNSSESAHSDIRTLISNLTSKAVVSQVSVPRGQDLNAQSFCTSQGFYLVHMTGTDSSVAVANAPFNETFWFLNFHAGVAYVQFAMLHNKAELKFRVWYTGNTATPTAWTTLCNESQVKNVIAHPFTNGVSIPCDGTVTTLPANSWVLVEAIIKGTGQLCLRFGNSSTGYLSAQVAYSADTNHKGASLLIPLPAGYGVYIEAKGVTMSTMAMRYFTM